LLHGVTRPAFSPDGRLLACNEQNRILLVNVETGTVVHELYDPGTGTAHEALLSSLAFNDRGNLLLSACGRDGERRVRLWDVGNGCLLLTIPAGGTITLDAAFSPDGSSLAVAFDRQVLLNDLGGMHETAVAALQPHIVHDVQVSSDGKRLGCLVEREPQPDASWQAEVVLWQGETGQQLGSESVPGGWGRGGRPLLAMHPDANAVVSSTPERRLDFWDLRSPQKSNQVPISRMDALTFAADGASVWAVEDGNRVQSWSWPDGQRRSRWQNQDLLTSLDSLNCLAAGKQWVLAGCRNGQVYWLRNRDGQREHSGPGPGGPVRSVGLNSQETLAVVGTQDGRVRLLRVPSGETTADLAGQRTSVEVAAFSPDGRWLATASQDGEVRVWLGPGDAVDPYLILQSTTGPVRRLAFGADGDLFLLEGRDHCVRVWHLERLRERLEAMGLSEGPAN
jgi:WD40 repeat protein